MEQQKVLCGQQRQDIREKEGGVLIVYTNTKCNIKSKQTSILKNFEFKKKQGLITATKSKETRSSSYSEMAQLAS